MQTLYTIDSVSGETKPGEPEVILKNKIEQSRNLFSYLVYFITEVARFAETDARQKASKHLPTEKDLNINTKISGNLILWKTLESASFVKASQDAHFDTIINNDLLKKIYNELISSEEYKEYIEALSREKKSEKKILEFIFTQLLLPNEDFISHLEELFINWDDDAELMHALVLNYLNKPESFNFTEILSSEKWEYAKDLLKTVIDKANYTLEMIKPKLKNWDADRIAALDLIILQMGVCEFLYFETIPTKVTINEYIDIAKSYSTQQSGQFVNGILDSIHKDLVAEGKLKKVDFKKQG